MWPWDVNVNPGPSSPPLPVRPAVLDRLADRCRRRFGPGVPPHTDVAGNDKPLFGIRGIEASTTYQAIYWQAFARGYAERRVTWQAVWLRVRLGERETRLYGRPDAATVAAVVATTDPRRLRSWCRGLGRAAGWADLLGG